MLEWCEESPHCQEFNIDSRMWCFSMLSLSTLQWYVLEDLYKHWNVVVFNDTTYLTTVMNDMYIFVLLSPWQHRNLQLSRGSNQQALNWMTNPVLCLSSLVGRHGGLVSSTCSSNKRWLSKTVCMYWYWISQNIVKNQIPLIWHISQMYAWCS